MGQSEYYNPEFARLHKVSTAFEERAQRLPRTSRLDKVTIVAFTNYQLFEPFRDELIAKLRHHRARYPRPPATNEIPKVFGFIARPVIDYLTMVRITANWPHAWRISREGDRTNPDDLQYILNPESPRYYDSAANRVENFVESSRGITLVQDIRAQNWQPRRLDMAS